MKAVVVTAFGEPAGLEVRELPDPVPGPGQVVVRTRAAGVNFPDLLMVQGRYQVRPLLPFSPGFEVAGIVEAVGEGVDRLAPGDRVLALLAWGGYAERALAAAAHVFRIPEAMGFEEAAAFGIVYQTGYCALVHRAGLRAQEWLLVHGAAGGVGLAAVQLGRALGARVIAAAGSEAKLQVAREAGAEILINYTAEDWVAQVRAVTGGAGADVVYDPVGGDVFDASLRCLAFEGRLLTIGFAGGRIPSVAVNRILLKNVSVVGVHWGLYQQRGSPWPERWMAALFELYHAGRIRPLVSRTFAIQDAAQALGALARRDAYGKVVLLP